MADLSGIIPSEIPYKRETRPAINRAALLAQRPEKEERMSIVSVFYHVIPVCDHVKPLNLWAVLP